LAKGEKQLKKELETEINIKLEGKDGKRDKPI
jgi:hypothetical protein